MVTDVYSEIIDEDSRFNAQKMDKDFYSTLNDDDTDNPKQYTAVSDSDMALLELIKSLSPEIKKTVFKASTSKVEFQKNSDFSSKIKKVLASLFP